MLIFKKVINMNTPIKIPTEMKLSYFLINSVFEIQFEPCEIVIFVDKNVWQLAIS